MMQIRTAAAPEYYLAPDYQTEGSKIEARWGGKGSQMVGVSGPFGTLSFLRLAKGLNPETGGKLTARLKANRRAAWDVTITVPKSVSVLIEVAEDDGVKKALLDANDFAMRQLEKQAQVRVRKGGVYDDRATGNIAYASFYHGTTRPAKDDGLPDPHSHIHNYLLNLTYDRKEGEWKALQIGNVDRPGIEKAFHRRLARNLKELGYDARVVSGKKATTVEVRGVAEDVQARFSRRNYEVERFASEKGYQSAKAKARLGQFTRSPKVSNISMQDVRRYWVSRLTGDQFEKLSDAISRARRVAMRGRLSRSISNHIDSVRRLAFNREATHERGRSR